MQQTSQARWGQLLMLHFVLVLAWLAPACVRLPRRHAQEAILHQTNTEHAAETAPNDLSNVAPRLNLNTATREELEKLPGVGETVAARIVEHRMRYGDFRRVEHLLMVPGISDRLFRQMQSQITVADGDAR